MVPWTLIDTPSLGNRVSHDELTDREYSVLSIGVERKKGESNPARRWEVDGQQLPCYAEITKRINP